MSNYFVLLQDEAFLSAFLNSIIFTVIIVPVIITVCILIALLIQRMESDRLRQIVLVVLYIPCITSPIAYSLFFKQIAYSDGILSSFLRLTTLVSENYNILQDPWGARLLIAFVCVWAWFGFYVLLLSNAMRNIDSDIYSVAKLDGASRLTIFRKIILPQIRPILLLVIILSTINTFQIYIESAIITKGGPGMATLTLGTELYKVSFTYVAQYGYSASIGVVIFLVSIIMTALVLIYMRKHEQKY